MRVRRTLRAGASLWLAIATLGSDCGEGSGENGSPGRVESASADPDCVALTQIFPPAFDFLPIPSAAAPARVLVGNLDPSGLAPLDIEARPFVVPGDSTTLALPDDADGDGLEEGSLVFLPAPVIDDVVALAPDLAVVTTSSYEALLFVDPMGAMASLEVSVPAAFGPDAFRFLPGPGAPAELRSGAANFWCLVPPAGATDSRGDAVSAVLDPARFCESGVPSYRASFTSGVARAAGRLFVAVSNLGDAQSQGTADTQFLPGAVLVYEFDAGASPPRLSPSASAAPIFTTGFNPTHVTAYTTPGGRELVLVTVTGAIGILPDDPNTSAREGGTLRLTPGAVDVIDAASGSLIASVPLGLASPSFRRLAIDPSGRLALLGDAADRRVYAIDLAPLDALPGPGGPLRVLDGSSGPNAIVFDAAAPFTIPGIVGGAPESRCPGFIESLDFSAAGDRAFALDSCNGTLTEIEVDLTGAPAAPLAGSRLRVGVVHTVAAPLRADRTGEPQQPAAVRVRPGQPGVDYQGPDVFFTRGQPEGELCGIRIDAP